MELQRPFAVVTPTVDGDVLAVLAGADADFTVTQIAGIVVSRSTAGIRNSLERLADQGVVDVREAGRTRTYRLNRDHLAADAILLVATQRARLLDRLRSRVSGWNRPPVFGALFGSAARESMGPESDLDIFLVRPDGVEQPTVWESDVAELSRDVTRWTGNDTRVLDLPEHVVTEWSHAAGVLQSIHDEGVAFAGEPSWLRTARRRASESAYA